MIPLVVVVLAIALRAAAGRSVSELANVRLRGEAGLLATYALVFVLPLAASAFRLPAGPVIAVWLALILALACLTLLNRRLSFGFVLMSTGSVANFLAIASVGAMAVSEDAARLIVQTGVVRGDLLHRLAASSPLLVLSDVIPLLGPPGIRSVLSVGDVLLFVGLVVVVLSIEPSPVHTKASRPE